MSKLTILEASRQFKINRARIYRAIESGKITAIVDNDGTKSVDISDMVRVFNDRKTKHTDTNQTEQIIQNEHQANNTELLQEQLKFAKEQVEFYKLQANEIRKDFDDFKSIALLNAPRNLENSSTDRTDLNRENDTKKTTIKQTEQTSKKWILTALIILVISVITLATLLFLKIENGF